MSGAGSNRPRSGLTRRGFVMAAGASFLAACTSTTERRTKTSLANSSSGSSGVTASTVSLAPLAAAEFDDLAICRALPEMSAGPFGLEQQFNRSDISEGLDGRPLRLGLRIVDQDCQPLSDVDVEVWHADATGDYSAFSDEGTGKDEAEGSTFLRGTQRINERGIVEFHSVYPGWYPGRSPHIHLRVRRDESAIFTTQLFFPDGYSAEVYAAGVYADNGTADTSNQEDSLAGDVESDGTLLHLRDAQTLVGTGSLALANVGLPS